MGNWNSALWIPKYKDYPKEKQVCDWDGSWTRHLFMGNYFLLKRMTDRRSLVIQTQKTSSRTEYTRLLPQGNNGYFFVAHKVWVFKWQNLEHLYLPWSSCNSLYLIFFSNELGGDGRSGLLVLYIEIGPYLKELKNSWTGIFQMTMAWCYDRTHRWKTHSKCKINTWILM